MNAFLIPAVVLAGVFQGHRGIHRVDASDAFPATEREEEVRDRAGFFGSAGDYVMAQKINGEWRPVVIGCPGFAG